uniref:Reverse transcriptase domain-containing protein n=1 Tax=Tanacetum cinerariifolium TaxID=118510 RepID=A0A699GRY5_TANCI|nr:reverse transcriptase domain-containing protein [Tanacetum cinerariifolium]
MLITRKRVGHLPTHRLAVRHSVDYSSSDHFTSNDSSSDSPSNSSSDTSLDSSSNAPSDSSSGHSSSDHSSPALPTGMRFSNQLCSSVSSIPRSSAAITKRQSHSSYVGPSCKRSRSPTTSVPLSSHVPGALSSIRADLLPPLKRIRSFDSMTDLEGIDARVVDETVAQDEVETSTRGMVEVGVDRVTHHAVSDDIPEHAQEEGAIEATMTREAVNELIDRRVAEALETHDVARNLKPPMEDAIRIANNLMDQKLKGYAWNAKNKRRFDNNPRDSREQKPYFKRQNIRDQSVARAYTVGNNEKRRPRHYRKDYLKLRNQNRRNKTRNKTGNNEATTKAYAIERGRANPDSNVITGTFLLNNCYASMLFDSGADRSFVSSTFSALLDVEPSTLDTSYAVKLAERISKTNVVLRGCTLDYYVIRLTLI